MNKLTFNHPLRELYFTSGYTPPQYTEHNKLKQDGYVLEGIFNKNFESIINLKTKETKSSFLRELIDDLELITYNAIYGDISYIKSSKPLKDFQKDEIYNMVLNKPDNITLYDYIQTLDLGNGFDYLLLTYMFSIDIIDIVRDNAYFKDAYLK